MSTNYPDPNRVPYHVRRWLPENDPLYLPPVVKPDLRQPGKPTEQVSEPQNPAGQRYLDREESKIQGQIVNYLRLNFGDDFPFIRPDMRKKSTLPPGWPDISFCYRPKGLPAGLFGVPCALEVKVPGKNPEAHQKDFHVLMRNSGWCVRVVYGVADVQALFRELDQRYADILS